MERDGAYISQAQSAPGDLVASVLLWANDWWVEQYTSVVAAKETVGLVAWCVSCGHLITPTLPENMIP